MSQRIQEKNKALVLEAFDTLFNRRDYATAERFWSSNYIQHSAPIAPGREGHLPDAHLIMYPDSSHGAQYQHAELFLKHAKLFLSA